jgi:hypothetical protein
LIKTGTANAFIRTQAISKAIFDSIQGMHPKILVCTLPLTTTGKDTYRKFFDRILDIRIDPPGPPRIEKFKEMHMPRQHLLKAIDPDCIKSIGYALDQHTPIAKQYEQYVLNDEYEQVLDFNGVLDAYAFLHTLLIKLREERFFCRVRVKAATLMLCVSMQHSLRPCSTQKCRNMCHQNQDFARKSWF